MCRCEGFTHTGRQAMKLTPQVKSANLGLYSPSAYTVQQTLHLRRPGQHHCP